jgi:microcystin-dependent protein
MKIICMLLASALTLLQIPTHASDLVTYQGKLTNAASAALPDGQYRIGLRIWDVEEGGETPLWARKYDVPVTAGVFSLMIGAEGLPWGVVGQAGGPLTVSLKLALSGTNRFVEIAVMSDANGAEKPPNEWQTLAPRQSLNAVPYAMNGVPTGTVVPFAGSIPPDGWAFCDGTTTFPINDARYRSLHNTIGTMFNNGTEPEGHFRLPDLRGRTPIGRGKGDTWFLAGQDLSTNWVLGQRFGTEKHKLSTGEMPSHVHSGTTGPGNSITYRTAYSNGSRSDSFHQVGYASGSFHDRTDANYSNSSHTHSFTTNPTGGDAPHNNMQPIIVLNYIIKL